MCDTRSKDMVRLRSSDLRWKAQALTGLRTLPVRHTRQHDCLRPYQMDRPIAFEARVQALLSLTVHFYWFLVVSSNVFPLSDACVRRLDAACG